MIARLQDQDVLTRQQKVVAHVKPNRKARRAGVIAALMLATGVSLAACSSDGASFGANLSAAETLSDGSVLFPQLKLPELPLQQPCPSQDPSYPTG
ncbi:hypothetical protein, partial [Streptomyces griseoaurantiacus]|uniref:hypothetical protein n=1 Tax=Streptomyces griseoaurantiacus TaxID=68213 RepID=UPI001BC8A93E